MAVARTTQVAVEVLRANTSPAVQTKITQVAVEVLRQNSTGNATNTRPQVFICT